MERQMLLENLRIGSTQMQKTIVTESMLAKQIGSGDLDVLATPVVLNMMEQLASHMILADLNSQDFTSVGTSAKIRHLAPTPLGVEVNIKATVIGIDRKKIVFRMEVTDPIETIADGVHERMLVNRRDFFAKAERKINNNIYSDTSNGASN